MRVYLTILCCCIASARAGIIGYPLTALGYDGFDYPNVLSHPLTTYTHLSRPFLPAYPGHYGYSLVLGPTPFSHSLFPGQVYVTGVPGIVYPPLTPVDERGKGKGKKKPNKKNDESDESGESDDDDNDGKDSKEETTEKPKTEKKDSKSEVEDLRENKQ